jgi:hypothetical protein
MAKIIIELGSQGGLNDGWGRSFANHGPLLQEALSDGETPSQETLSYTHPIFYFFKISIWCP